MAKLVPIDISEYSDVAEEKGKLVPIDMSEYEDPERDAADYITDPFSAVMRGGVGAVKGAAGLLDFLTYPVQAGLSEDGKTGYFGAKAEKILDLEDAETFWKNQRSTAQQAADMKVEDAEGFKGTAKALLTNPSAAGNVALESAIPTIVGGTYGRALKAVAPVGRAVAGGAGEGLQQTGSFMEDSRSASEDGRATGRDATLAAVSGAGTAAIGVAGGKLGKAMKVDDLDLLVAGGREGIERVSTLPQAGRRVAGGVIQEGVFEEAGQSAWETATSNIQARRPVDEGIGKAVATGMAAGGIMGGTVNAATSSVDLLSSNASPATAAASPPPNTDPEYHNALREEALELQKKDIAGTLTIDEEARLDQILAEMTLEPSETVQEPAIPQQPTLALPQSPSRIAVPPTQSQVRPLEQFMNQPGDEAQAGVEPQPQPTMQRDPNEDLRRQESVQRVEQAKNELVDIFSIANDVIESGGTYADFSKKVKSGALEHGFATEKGTLDAARLNRVMKQAGFRGWLDFYNQQVPVIRAGEASPIVEAQPTQTALPAPDGRPRVIPSDGTVIELGQQQETTQNDVSALPEPGPETRQEMQEVRGEVEVAPPAKAAPKPRKAKPPAPEVTPQADLPSAETVAAPAQAEAPQASSGLSQEKKSFIEGKVRDLGSVEAVESFYDQNDEVGSYAREVAGKTFGKTQAQPEQTPQPEKFAKAKAKKAEVAKKKAEEKSKPSPKPATAMDSKGKKAEKIFNKAWETNEKANDGSWDGISDALTDIYEQIEAGKTVAEAIATAQGAKNTSSMKKAVKMMEAAAADTKLSVTGDSDSTTSDQTGVETPSSKHVSRVVAAKLGIDPEQVTIREVKPTSKGVVALAQAIYKLFGVRVMFVSGLDKYGAEGVFNANAFGPNILVVNQPVGNDITPMRVMGHELLHALRNRNPILYLQFVRAVFRYMDVNAIFDNNLEYNRRMKAMNPKAKDSSIAYTLEEQIGDFLAQKLLDNTFWNEIAEFAPKKADVLQKVAQFFSDMIQKVKDYFAANPSKDVEASGLFEDLDIASNLLAQYVAGNIGTEAVVTKGKAETKLSTNKGAVDNQDKSVYTEPQGVNVEIAPNPDNKELAEKFSSLPVKDQQEMTRMMADAIIPKVMEEVGAKDFSLEHNVGGFEGATSPTIILKMPGAGFRKMKEAGQILGSLWKQKSVIIFDEKDKSKDQAQFIKVIPSRKLSYEESANLFTEVSQRFPAAEGMTARDGALVFGNFSAFSEKVDAVEPADFHRLLKEALAQVDLNGATAETAEFYFRSEYVGEPVTLKGTRYDESNNKKTAAGRNLLRGRKWSYNSLQGESDRIFNDELERRSTRLSLAMADSGRSQKTGVGQHDKGRTSSQQARGRITDVLPVREDGRVVLKHYSMEPRDILSTFFVGTGIEGSEKRKRQNYPDLYLSPIYTAMPGQYDMEVALRTMVWEHDISIDPDTLYDYQLDPDGIVKATYDKLHKDTGAFVPVFFELSANKAIYDAGYNGMYATVEAGQQAMAVLWRSVKPEYAVHRITGERVDIAGLSEVVPDKDAPKPPNWVDPNAKKAGAFDPKTHAGDLSKLIDEAGLAGQIEGYKGYKLWNKDSELYQNPIIQQVIAEEWGNQSDGTRFSLSPPTDSKKFRDWFGNSITTTSDGNPQAMYRGMKGEHKEGRNPHIIWTTSNPDYANEYAGAEAGANVMPLYVKVTNPADLGFRSTTTDVKLGDVLDRVKRAVTQAFTDGKITREQGLGINDRISDLSDKATNEFKKVHQWWTDVKEIKGFLAEAGYDAIISKEGQNDSVPAYGVFDADQIRSATRNMDTRFSLSPEAEVAGFTDQLRKYRDKTVDYRQPLVVGKTPLIYKAAKFKPLPVVITQGTVDKILSGKSGDRSPVGLDTLKSLPEHLHDPVAVFRSKDGDNDLVVLTGMTDKLKVPVVVSIRRNESFARYDVNRVTSAYGKDRLLEFVGKEYQENRLLYINKEKGLAADVIARLQLPGMRGQLQAQFETTIAKKNAIVNTPAEETRFSLAPPVDSPSFRNWFGDSKVVDADGKPLVVYHATKKDLTVLEPGGSQRDTDMNAPLSGTEAERDTMYLGMESGPGIWLAADPNETNAAHSLRDTDTDTEMRKYDDRYPGPNIMPLYVSIKNPLRIRSHMERKAYGEDLFPAHKAMGKVEFPYRLDGQQRRALKAKGFDGIFLEIKGEPKEFIAFDSTQIKSAIGNVGTYDPNNPDIRLSLADDAKKAFQYAGHTVRENGDIISKGSKVGNINSLTPWQMWKAVALSKVVMPLDRLIDGTGRIPMLKEYLRLRRLALGELDALESRTREIYDLLKGLTTEQAKSVYEYFTTKEADSSVIPENIRQQTVEIKEGIIKIGRMLVERGLLPQAALDVHEDSYLPRRYLKYIMKEEGVTVSGAGKGIRGEYMKQRKNISKIIRENVLGEVTDPAYLASRANAMPMRDIILYDFLEKIMLNPNWALPESLVDYSHDDVPLRKIGGLEYRQNADGTYDLFATTNRLQENKFDNVPAQQLSQLFDSDLAKGILANQGKPVLVKRGQPKQWAIGAWHEFGNAKYKQNKDGTYTVKLKERKTTTMQAKGVEQADLGLHLSQSQIDSVMDGKGNLDGGRKMTPLAMMAEAERLQKMALDVPSERRAEVERLAGKLRERATEIIKQIKADKGIDLLDPDTFTAEWRQLPNTMRYGSLRGMLVRKEIFDDLIGNISFMLGERGVAEQLLAEGGRLHKAHGIWKWTKTAGNISTHFRNFYSNMILMQLSGGIPVAKVPFYYAKAAQEVFNHHKKRDPESYKHYAHALQHGLGKSSFSDSEMGRIETEFMDLLRRSSDKKGLSWLMSMAKYWGAQAYNKTGDAYQMNESIGKTAVMMYQMEGFCFSGG